MSPLGTGAFTTPPPAVPCRPVVAAKLRAPRLRVDELPRAALVDALCEANVPVVAVRAGAGYGKTTTVRQWIERDGRAAAWVTVDESDNDLVSLLRELVDALGLLEPLPEVEAALSVDRPRVREVALPRLGEALARFGRPFVLVLDDVHLLDNPAVGELLELLVALLPEGSTLALVGRALPPMRLTRHLVSDDALVLRRGDLAFTDRECRTVLEEAVPGLGPDALDILVDRIEGWPAGCYLSVLALKGAMAPDRIVNRLTRTESDLGHYFHEELMRGLDSAIRAFLVRTSILPRLSGDLCDAVLDRSDSALVLRDLAASDNLFVVALDDDPDTYRYHRLFADLLVAELPYEAPGEEADLRQRAARWLADHDDADGAVQQAVAAGDPELATSLVLRHLAELVQTGRLETLERWVNLFPADDVRRRPALAVASGWACLARGDFVEAGHWLEHLDLPRTEVGSGAIDQRLHLARAALSMVQGGGGVRAVAANAGQVLAAGPEDNPWWATARLMEAVATPLADPEADAVALCSSAEFATRADPTAHAVALAHLAWAQLRVGDDPSGDASIAQALAEIDAEGLAGYPLVLHVQAVGAYALARRGDREAAGRAIAATHDLLGALEQAVPRGRCHAGLILADAALLLGDVGLVAQLLGEARPLLRHEPDAVVLWQWVDRLGDTVAVSSRQATQVAQVGITEAEARVLAELPTHRSLEEIGEVLYVSRNTVKTHAVSIYRKLGVSGRSAAVERARALGLLEVGVGEEVTPSG